MSSSPAETTHLKAIESNVPREADDEDETANDETPTSRNQAGKLRTAEVAVEEEEDGSASDGGKEGDSDKPQDGTAEDPETSTSHQLQEQQPSSTPSAEGTPWQAVFAPQYNAYYFFNNQTGETTWQNPLDPSASASSSAAGPSISSAAEQPTPQQPQPYAPYDAVQQAALQQGIDPALAYLDPTLASSSSSTPAQAFQAKFNARTGAFTAMNARDPSHLSEYERMKRMSDVFFDVNKWEQEVQTRDAEEQEAGKKRKRPTKKDLERFKEQKKQKKIAKTAWLRT
ncbi:hypothetical protein BD626DRAFT_484877 [Schizophyllum amplum]|uniref:WW domain-containing protein n=1 Tax=Schizophyllum amplum TaxID=97359 RepID=A0A550CQS5_9AGAR|nr:hypothetical protein BD626DRAFT_484877 [Auriculariopsis ampla]